MDISKSVILFLFLLVSDSAFSYDLRNRRADGNYNANTVEEVEDSGQKVLEPADSDQVADMFDKDDNDIPVNQKPSERYADTAEAADLLSNNFVENDPSIAGNNQQAKLPVQSAINQQAVLNQNPAPVGNLESVQKQPALEGVDNNDKALPVPVNPVQQVDTGNADPGVVDIPMPNSNSVPANADQNFVPETLGQDKATAIESQNLTDERANVKGPALTEDLKQGRDSFDSLNKVANSDNVTGESDGTDSNLTATQPVIQVKEDKGLAKNPGSVETLTNHYQGGNQANEADKQLGAPLDNTQPDPLAQQQVPAPKQQQPSAPQQGSEQQQVPQQQQQVPQQQQQPGSEQQQQQQVPQQQQQQQPGSEQQQVPQQQQKVPERQQQQVPQQQQQLPQQQQPGSEQQQVPQQQQQVPQQKGSELQQQVPQQQQGSELQQQVPQQQGSELQQQVPQQKQGSDLQQQVPDNQQNLPQVQGNQTLQEHVPETQLPQPRIEQTEQKQLQQNETEPQAKQPDKNQTSNADEQSKPGNEEKPETSDDSKKGDEDFNDKVEEEDEEEEPTEEGYSNREESNKPQDKEKDLPKIDISQSEDTHFMTYLVTTAVLIVVFYLLYHNKSKVMGLLIEGRGASNRSRTNSASRYKRLSQQSSDDESARKKGANVIY